jgi:hypothetical protein
MGPVFDILFKIEFLIGVISLTWLGFTVIVEKLRKIPRWAAFVARKFNELYSGSMENTRLAREERRLGTSGKPSMV